MRRGLHNLRLRRGFLRDGFHGIDEQVAFFHGLRFRRLDHQGSRHNQRKRRGIRMKAIVDQAFCDVHGAHAVFLLNGVAKHHFVHRGQRIRQFVGALKLLSNVIRVQHGVFRGLPHSRAVCQNVRQRANQNAEIAGERFHSADGIRTHRFQRQTPALLFHQDGHRTERLENFLHRHRTCARTSAAVRGRKGFVQVQVHHVNAQIARPRHAGQRVHVRAVHIQQGALAVQDLRDFRNALLKNSQCRGIGDHQSRDVSSHLVAELFDVDLSVRLRLDVFDFVSGDDRRRRIGPVRGIRNQYFLAWIPLLLQISAYQQQAGHFAMRPGCRLQRDGVHTGDF